MIQDCDRRTGKSVVIRTMKRPPDTQKSDGPTTMHTRAPINTTEPSIRQVILRMGAGRMEGGSVETFGDFSFVAGRLFCGISWTVL